MEKNVFSQTNTHSSKPWIHQGGKQIFGYLPAAAVLVSEMHLIIFTHCVYENTVRSTSRNLPCLC